MPRGKTVNIDFKDILDSLDDRDFEAELLRNFTDRFGSDRELRRMLTRDISNVKRYGYFKYYQLIYKLLKAAREHNMYVDVAGDGLGQQLFFNLCGFAADADAYSAEHITGVHTKSFKPSPVEIRCAPSLKPLVLRSMMKTKDATVRLHSAIAVKDPMDVDNTSLGILFNAGNIDMHDIVLTHKGCKKYMPWPNRFIPVCNDMVCVPVTGYRSLELMGTTCYLAQTLCTPDQAKQLYPAEFYASLIRCCSDDPNDFETATALAAKANELVLLPHVNYSQAKCWVVDYDGQRSIMLGLSDIQGVDLEDARSILAERKDNGPFLDMNDFVSRCSGLVVNSSVIDAVIHSGSAHVDQHTFLQRCFQYNSALFSRSYRYDHHSLDMIINEVSSEVARDSMETSMID